MQILLTIIALGFAVTGIIGWVLIVIDAFQDEVWKGIVSLFCGLYLLYYGLFEFEHDNKWMILLMAFAGSGIATGILRFAHL